MKLKILQENLNEAFHITSRFTSSHVQLPVLANVLLSARNNKLLVSATNLEMSVSITLGAQVEGEGEITVPSRIITDLVSNLPLGTISLESEKEQLIISGEEFKSNISGMNSSDYPSLPKEIGKTSLNLENKALIEGLSQVLFAVSTDETRPFLTGILFVFKGKEALIVATDGFRLSRKKITLDSNIKEEKIIIPKGILGELSRLLKSENVKFEYRKDDKQVVFAVDKMILASRVIEGEFPDFERIIPKTSNIKVFVDKEELLRAVKLASVFAREAANVVKIIIRKDAIELAAESQLSGSGENKVDAKVEFLEGDYDDDKKLSIAFNYRFLEDFVNSVTGEEVQIGLNDPNSPGVFTDPKDSNYLHLIMPVRIQS